MRGRGRGRVRPTTFYAERGRTSPLWRAWQLAAIALAALSLAGYWTLTSTAGEARRIASARPFGEAPSFTLLLAGRDIAYCSYHTPCADQTSPDARLLTRTDTIMLLKVDGARVSVLSIPRDTQVGEYNPKLDAGNQKINAAYSFGGPERLARRVEELTGERVDYYAVVLTSYVAKVIDALGGLDVSVPKPGLTWVDRAANVDFHLAPGPHHLGGKDAVLFLRVRKGFGDDYGRIDHQKAALAQLVDKLKSPRGLAALPVLLGGFRAGVETDADPALAGQLLPRAGEYALSFATLPTDPIPGTTNLAPDQEALARVWGGGEQLASTRKPRVRIFDAGGANLGEKLAWALRARGFDVLSVATEPKSGERSQVFTLDAVGGAQRVADLLDLPRLQGLRFPVDGGEVGVLLGPDAGVRYAELARLTLPKTPASPSTPPLSTHTSTHTLENP